MIKIEKAEVWGWEHAIRGMRNPMNSWERSDTEYGETHNAEIGQNDYDLMARLIKGGQPHRKFLRQIFVSVDITAPLYWWKEFDTYKVGTTANSCSTMHKIAAKEFELDDFSHEHLTSAAEATLNSVIERLNMARKYYNSKKEANEMGLPSYKEYWWDMIQLLPSSYNQKRTVTMTYENLLNMLEYRRGHKLDEWREFCEWIFTLPNSHILREGIRE